MGCSDGDVVDEAEAHRVVFSAVMTWRSDGTEGGRRLRRAGRGRSDDRVDCFDGRRERAFDGRQGLPTDCGG